MARKSNGFSIAGFILSFLIPIFGLIFSIVGLCFVKECGSGKGLGIAGIVISCIRMLLTILSIVLGIFVYLY